MVREGLRELASESRIGLSQFAQSIPEFLALRGTVPLYAYVPGIGV